MLASVSKDAIAFLWLGFGTSYTLGDSTLGNMAAFMRIEYSSHPLDRVKEP